MIIWKNYAIREVPFKYLKVGKERIFWLGPIFMAWTSR